jgi:hypothetical protein
VGRYDRRIPDIKELLWLPIARKAKLLEVEVIAVVLYTGPMVRRMGSFEGRKARDTCVWAVFDCVPL